MESALNCTKCNLHKTRKNIVWSDGCCPNEVMLIGDAPRVDDDNIGKPFVGDSGKLLTKMLASIGLIRPVDPYMTYIVKCITPGYQNLLPAEISACKLGLDCQIFACNPKVLIIVGSVAMKVMFPALKNEIAKVRGKWLEFIDEVGRPIKTMVIYHPSYLLKNPSKEVGSPKWITWNDLKNVRKYLNNKVF